jgi:hypothetical protein
VLTFPYELLEGAEGVSSRSMQFLAGGGAAGVGEN